MLVKERDPGGKSGTWATATDFLIAMSDIALLIASYLKLYVF